MSRQPESDVTVLLGRWQRGDREALGQLVPLVYEELRRLARAKMAAERGAHTLEPTALVHEAFLRLTGLRLSWRDRAHFLAMAARVMRRVLVDHARARRAAKRGDGAIRVALGDPAAGEPDLDLLALDTALEHLRERDERPVRVIELHYFGGLTYDEIAAALSISKATVDRDLRFARAWLGREIAGGER